MNRDGIILGRQYDSETVIVQCDTGEDVRICGADANRVSILFSGGLRMANPDGLGWAIFTKAAGASPVVTVLNFTHPTELFRVSDLGSFVFGEFWASNNSGELASLIAVIVRQTTELPECRS